MKTFCQMITRFNKRNPGYHAYLDLFESYRGYYRVYISGPDSVGALYTFASVREFKEWMDGVVLD